MSSRHTARRPDTIIAESGEFTFSLEKLPRFQIRAMLNFLKVKHTNGGKDQMVARLKEAMQADRAAANKAWKGIVLADIGASEDGGGGMDEDRVREIVDEQLEEKSEKDIKKAVTETVSKLDLGGFKRIEVVLPDGKGRKMKDIMPEEFEQILQLASQRVNTMLIGPAGCGKTFVSGKIAEALGVEFASISCSEGLSESALAGWLLPVGRAGNFEHVGTDFLRLYEKGGLFLIDEGDNADANTFTFLNQALANDGFYVPQRYNSPYIKRHKDFICLMSANTFGTGADAMYVGRNQLDAATLDRYCAGRVLMDYSPRVEESLIDSEVLKWGRGIRTKIREHRLRRIMSTRILLDLTKMKRGCKWGAKEWERAYFIGWTRDELELINRR